MVKSPKLELTNIGPAEIGKRRAIGIIMAVLSVIIIAGLIIFKANEWLTIILVFPYMGAFIGFLQAKNKT